MCKNKPVKWYDYSLIILRFKRFVFIYATVSLVLMVNNAWIHCKPSKHINDIGAEERPRWGTTVLV